MKNLWISVKITLAMCLLLGVGYVLVLRGVSALAGPNGGQAETLTLDGRVVGQVHEQHCPVDGPCLLKALHEEVRLLEGDFWGRPSAVDYNGGGSGGSNKATTNPEYLADVEQRVQDFLAAHPYLSRGEVPSEMVTASGSGLDPDISPRGAQVQVRRVAAARGLDEAVVQRLVDSLTQKPWLGLFGTAKVNVLRLNIALETLQPNVTASAGVRQAGGCGEGVSPEN